MPSNIFQKILTKVVFKETVFKSALKKNMKRFWNNCQYKSSHLRKVFQSSIPQNSSQRSPKTDLQKYYSQTSFQKQTFKYQPIFLSGEQPMFFFTRELPHPVKASQSVQAPKSVKASKHLKASQSVQASETIKAWKRLKASQRLKAPKRTKAPKPQFMA